MTMEILLWVIGASILPLMAFGYRIHSMVARTLEKTEELVEHTKATTEYSRRLAGVMEDLTHLMEWLIERDGGVAPPPNVRSVPD